MFRYKWRSWPKGAVSPDKVDVWHQFLWQELCGPCFPTTALSSAMAIGTGPEVHSPPGTGTERGSIEWGRSVLGWSKSGASFSFFLNSLSLQPTWEPLCLSSNARGMHSSHWPGVWSLAVGNSLMAFIGLCLESSWAESALWASDNYTWPCWWQNWYLGGIKPYSQVK